jgi:cytochrome P450
LRPDGKPRSPYAFAPFHAGRRVCVGKTLAENMIRITLPILSHFLDFEYMDQKDDIEKPQNNGVLREKPVVMMKVTPRQ